MELDEFKTYWNEIQDKQQKLSPQKLEHIFMETTKTVEQLKEKNLVWSKFAVATCSMLIAVLLINLIIDLFVHNKTDLWWQTLAYAVCIIVYCLVTMWAYRRQHQIFTMYNSGDVKETLHRTLSAFKRFYILFNVIYLFLYPAFFYSTMKLFVVYWTPSFHMLLWICGSLTVVCLVAGHLYYKMRYFDKIALLRGNLRDLEEKG